MFIFVSIVVGLLLTLADYAAYQKIMFVYWLSYIGVVCVVFYGNKKYKQWKEVADFWYKSYVLTDEDYKEIRRDLSEIIIQHAQVQQMTSKLINK